MTINHLIILSIPILKMSLITSWIFKASFKLFKYANLALAKNNKNSNRAYIIRAMMKNTPNVSKKPTDFMSNIFLTDMPKPYKRTKNKHAGTIIYTILNTNTLRESRTVFPKSSEGNMEDSFKPILTIENKYPGTMRINMKKPIKPMIERYLLSITTPIGIMAIKINRIKRIGNFLMFLKGYLNEFEIIFPKSIINTIQTTFHFHFLRLVAHNHLK